MHRPAVTVRFLLILNLFSGRKSYAQSLHEVCRPRFILHNFPGPAHPECSWPFCRHHTVAKHDPPSATRKSATKVGPSAASPQDHHPLHLDGDSNYFMGHGWVDDICIQQPKKMLKQMCDLSPVLLQAWFGLKWRRSGVRDLGSTWLNRGISWTLECWPYFWPRSAADSLLWSKRTWHRLMCTNTVKHWSNFPQRYTTSLWVSRHTSRKQHPLKLTNKG